MTRFSTAPLEDVLPLLDGSQKKITFGEKTVDRTHVFPILLFGVACMFLGGILYLVQKTHE